MLIGTLKDTKLLFVYGYARLVGASTATTASPARHRRARSRVTEGGRSFTFYLRKGHRWSDGAPSPARTSPTAWTHVANDDELSPGGPPSTLRVDGEMPTVTFPDPWTVRFRWSQPNNLFLPDQAGAYPTILFRPRTT